MRSTVADCCVGIAFIKILFFNIYFDEILWNDPPVSIGYCSPHTGKRIIFRLGENEKNDCWLTILKLKEKYKTRILSHIRTLILSESSLQISNPSIAVEIPRDSEIYLFASYWVYYEPAWSHTIFTNLGDYYRSVLWMYPPVKTNSWLG